MASNTISSKLELTGEKEYQKALSDAYRQLRVLKGELKAETAEMGKNASAQDKARAKAASLKQQITQQEQVVKTLEAALAQSREEYADNADVQAKWENKLNDARAVLANMKSDMDEATEAMESFGEAAEDAGQGTEEAVTEVRNLNDSIKAVGDVAQSISGSIEGIFDSMVESIKTAVGEILSLVTEAGTAASDWKSVQTAYGGSIEDIQRYFRGGAGLGFDTATLTGELKTFRDAFYGQSDSWKAGMNALGIDTTQYSSMFDLYTATMQKLNMYSKGDKDSIIQSIFGGDENAAQIIAMWDDISKSYDKIVAGTGSELDQSQVDALNETLDKINEVQGAWNNLKLTLGAKLSEVLNIDELSEDVIAIIGDIASIFNDDGSDTKVLTFKLEEDMTAFFTTLGDSIGNLGDSFEEMGEGMAQSDNGFVRFIGKLMQVFGKLLDWISANGDRIIEWLEKLLPVIGANAVSEAVTGNSILENVGNIVNTASLLRIAGKGLFKGGEAVATTVATGGTVAGTTAGGTTAGTGMTFGTAAGELMSNIGTLAVGSLPILGTLGLYGLMEWQKQYSNEMFNNPGIDMPWEDYAQFWWDSYRNGGYGTAEELDYRSALTELTGNSDWYNNIMSLLQDGTLSLDDEDLTSDMLNGIGTPIINEADKVAALIQGLPDMWAKAAAKNGNNANGLSDEALSSIKSAVAGAVSDGLGGQNIYVTVRIDDNGNVLSGGTAGFRRSASR